MHAFQLIAQLPIASIVDSIFATFHHSDWYAITVYTSVPIAVSSPTPPSLSMADEILSRLLFM
jgi:hypothetical protein